MAVGRRPLDARGASEPSNFTLFTIVITSVVINIIYFVLLDRLMMAAIQNVDTEYQKITGKILFVVAHQSIQRCLTH